jgi:hypothetical protein
MKANKTKHFETRFVMDASPKNGMESGLWAVGVQQPGGRTPCHFSLFQGVAMDVMNDSSVWL